MTTGPEAADRLPPDDLDGWNSSWSSFVDAPDGAGIVRRWHVLDTGNADPELIVLAVHGNPTWSYTWRHLAAALPDSVRLIAPDHLDMGFSERTGVTRRLADRVADLRALTDHLELSGDVVVVAHDWGGPISLGWLEAAHTDPSSPITITGLVLTNTAVHQPEGASAPTVIRSARTPGVLKKVTVDTPTFLRGMFELSNPRTPAGIRRGYLAPYDTPARRQAIATFVEDIPLEHDHPTASTLDAIADGLAELHDVPTLLVWGAGDRVFSDLYLHDLEGRLPHAVVHRHPSAGHLVSEDIDVASTIVDWLDARPSQTSTPNPLGMIDLTAMLREPAIADRVAIREMAGSATSITFAELDTAVQETAEALLAVAGINPGERVALMIPPGIDLAIAMYGCWRMGAVPVLVDGGLGPKRMSAAMRVANPDHLIGIPKALAAARALRWPGRTISSAPLSGVTRRLLGTAEDLPGLRRRRPASVDLPTVDVDTEAAIVFTSGSTGPSKGVRYTASRIAAQVDALVDLYDITPDDSLVAAFAPFALYGPAMGITSTVPDMDVSSPGTLDASTLLAAVDAVDATMIFASPAAILSVLETMPDISVLDRSGFDQVRTLLSAGAPVPTHVLRRAVDEVVPNASAHTPYGMTECLPVASIDLATLESIDRTGLTEIGVCVGRPAVGVDVTISPLDDDGNPSGVISDEPGILGEVWVRAGHMRLGYERLWHTTHLASPSGGWHATGDIGALDGDGRLWIGGRTSHVLRTPSGPKAPVPIERAVDVLDFVRRSAAVAVGPPGAQVIVVIAEVVNADKKPRQASLERIDAIRSAVSEANGLDVAACLEVAALPVDRRHNSKIGRSELAEWALHVLEGGEVKAP